MPQINLALCFKMPRIESTVAPEGVWLPMVPKGTFKGDDGREWTNNNPENIIKQFVEKGQKRPFDIEHSTYLLGPKGEPAPAIGWLMELKNDNGAVLARVTFNEKGQQLLQGEEYAYYSPTFTYDSKGFVTSVTSAGLTNEPNLDVPALNRHENLPDINTNNHHPNHHLNKKEIEMDELKQVAVALGLPETASLEDVIAAIAALTKDANVALNRSSRVDLTKFVPIDTHQVALNRAETAETSLNEINEEKIEGLVDAAVEAGKVAPKDKGMYVALCHSQSGREQFESFVKSAPSIVSDKQTKTPKVEGETVLEEHELAMCRSLQIPEADFIKQKNALK